MRIFKIQIDEYYGKKSMSLCSSSTGGTYFTLDKVTSIRNLAKALNEAADRMEGKPDEIFVEM